MGIGGISIWQLLIILLIVVLVFGTKKLKNMGKDMGEAVKGFKLSKSKYAAGHHFGTFKLTNEAIHEPVEHLSRALEDEAIEPHRFRPMRPGEVWDIPKS